MLPWVCSLPQLYASYQTSSWKKFTNSLTFNVDLASVTLILTIEVEGCGCTFSLIDKVGAEWQRIGVMLGITMNKLKGWDRQHRGDVTLCWGELVGHWKKSGGTSNYPHTWDSLYQLLCDIQYSQVAKKAVDDVHNSIVKFTYLTLLDYCVID